MPIADPALMRGRDNSSLRRVAAGDEVLAAFGLFEGARVADEAGLAVGVAQPGELGDLGVDLAFP